MRPLRPLRGLPNAILTPHMIGHTVEAHQSLAVATRDNLDLILAGRPPAPLCSQPGGAAGVEEKVGFRKLISERGGPVAEGPKLTPKKRKALVAEGPKLTPKKRRAPVAEGPNLTPKKRRALVAEGPSGAGPCGLTQARRTIAGTNALTFGAPTCCIIARVSMRRSSKARSTPA